MKRRQFASATVALVAGCASDAADTTDATATADGTPTPTGSAEQPTSKAVSKAAHELVNQARADHDRNALNWDAELFEIATDYSQRMASEGFFSHESPEGKTFQDRYDDAGYHCRIEVGDKIYHGAENIAQTWWQQPVDTGDGTETYTTAAELAGGLVDQWLASERHRKNILRDIWGHEAVGISITEEGQVYATQNFC